MLKGSRKEVLSSAADILEDEPARYKIVDDTMITAMCDKDAWDSRYMKALKDVFLSIIDLFLVHGYDVIVTSCQLSFCEGLKDVAEINEAELVKINI